MKKEVKKEDGEEDEKEEREEEEEENNNNNTLTMSAYQFTNIVCVDVGHVVSVSVFYLSCLEFLVNVLVLPVTEGQWHNR